MSDQTPINEPTPCIAKAHKRWKMNRDFVAGEEAVKGGKYLPKSPAMSDEEYQAYRERAPFFPAASRTLEGFVGLVFRKLPMLDVPASVAEIFDTITPAGLSTDDLAKMVFRETLITAYTGILKDSPAAPSGPRSLKQVEEDGDRPFALVYPAETILEIATGVVRNRQKLVRVRLLDDDETVRELRLDDDVYTVTMHRKIGTAWIAEAPITPLSNGKPYSEIQFELVQAEQSRDLKPGPAPMDAVVSLNRHLYRAQAQAEECRFYSSAPILWTRNVKIEGEGGLMLAPGAAINTMDVEGEKGAVLETNIAYVEFTGAGQAALNDHVATLKDEIAIVALRMLSTEKKAVEAAETHAIRRASENATLQAFAHSVSRRLEAVFQRVSDAMGAGPVAFHLNDDLDPTRMSADERRILLEEVLAGVIPMKLYLTERYRGETLPDDLTIDDLEQMAAEATLNRDRPAVTDADTE